MDKPEPAKPAAQEPVGKILSSVGGYSITIKFPTREAAIEYAQRRAIKVSVAYYGG